MLLTYTARIVDVYPKALVSADLTPSLSVRLSIHGELQAVNSINVVLRNRMGTVIKQESVIASQVNLKPDDDKEIVQWPLKKDEVHLWWPTGYGAQELYDVEVTLLSQVRFPYAK